MKSHPLLKYIRETGPAGQRLPLIMCPGCGAGQILNYVLRAVDSLIESEDMRQDDFNFISGVGCSARLTSHYLRFDSAWTIHGRTMAIATGVQITNPKLKTIVITGDGDSAAIGGNHLIHACRRNMDMTIVCVNNGLYGMTGGQVSPTTPLGQSTTTSLYGNVEDAFDLCKLTQSAGATYVARWTTAHPLQVIKAIKKGIKKKGTSFIDILSQCPVHYKKTPVEMYKEMKEKTMPINKSVEGDGKLAIGEFCDIEKQEWYERYSGILKQMRIKANEN